MKNISLKEIEEMQSIVEKIIKSLTDAYIAGIEGEDKSVIIHYLLKAKSHCVPLNNRIKWTVQIAQRDN